LPERRHAGTGAGDGGGQGEGTGRLGDAATKLRSELGESIATVQKFDTPLAEATTSSLEALKAYSLGLREQDAAAALAFLQHAIQRDPDFAGGYYAIGNKYESMGQVGRASEYFTKAFQLRERASERERLSIMAEYYSSVTGNWTTRCSPTGRSSTVIRKVPTLTVG